MLNTEKIGTQNPEGSPKSKSPPPIESKINPPKEKTKQTKEKKKQNQKLNPKKSNLPKNQIFVNFVKVQDAVSFVINQIHGKICYIAQMNLRGCTSHSLRNISFFIS